MSDYAVFYSTDFKIIICSFSLFKEFYIELTKTHSVCKSWQKNILRASVECFSMGMALQGVIKQAKGSVVLGQRGPMPCYPHSLIGVNLGVSVLS